ncbi:MAG: type II restriction endonuclease [Candidatus Hatepunaea meridiana]|nr:type II restriction endonuclease [Candidatus Hatepunaea meridiana]
MNIKQQFEAQLTEFVDGLREHISIADGQWSIKGFIDVFKNVYTLSSDTKIVSKILEIHLFPKILEFAKNNDYKIVLTDHQNYYPDISFIKEDNEDIKFAVDFKTTYRIPQKQYLCNGFTLGSHGKYFKERTSTKNIQYPYNSYAGHFCIGIIYNRAEGSTIEETKCYGVNELHSIVSVVKDFQFFVAEKWTIASDKSGSGNTANIGSINRIDDILNKRGMFSKLGEEWFDDYWMNYKTITISDGKGGTKKITALSDFITYRGGDRSLIVPKNNKNPKKD